MPPELSFDTHDPKALFSIIVFVVMGYLFSDVQENLKSANRKTSEALDAAQEANEKVSQLYEKSLESEKLKTHFFYQRKPWTSYTANFNYKSRFRVVEEGEAW